MCVGGPAGGCHPWFDLGIGLGLGIGTNDASLAGAAAAGAIGALFGGVLGLQVGLVAAVVTLPLSALAYRFTTSTRDHRLASAAGGSPALVALFHESALRADTPVVVSNALFVGVPAMVTSIAVAIAHHRSARLRSEPNGAAPTARLGTPTAA